jgi:F-box interacting protein
MSVYGLLSLSLAHWPLLRKHKKPNSAFLGSVGSAMSQSKQLSSEHLPYDVVFDILTRLPVKSLVRFRCVSKPWNSIITSPDFITTHMNRPKSLSNDKGYLLYAPKSEDCFNFYAQNLCIDVCNSDRTLTHISTFQLPFSALMVGFCNGLFCLRNMDNKVLYLWNPSIRKFKMISTPIDPFVPVAIGLAYHSQNNDFKILKMSCFLESNTPHAEVYTLSTDSWRRVVISLGSIDFLSSSFCNGALHFIASSESRQFILSFDFNDERFHEIMLPQNYDDDILELPIYRLAVFKGSLAFFVCDFGVDLVSDICYIWVMREYGVVESWTKISVRLDFENFFGCTDSGELLVDIKDRGLVSYDPVSLNENNLGIQSPRWVSYTADLMENLVLLNQVKCHLNMKISLLKFLAK